MNKRFSRLLSLILILCMIPATVITAFARGKGVYNSQRENQSIENAIGQFIPETITVDGYLNDTGWPASGFAKVDSNTGYWNTQSPTEAYKTLSYKYQIRADYEQLYLGASVVLPENVETATFTVYFKDKNVTADGYTDKLVFNIANGSVTQGTHEGITLSTAGTNGCLAKEANLFKANAYTFEFRNRLSDCFTASGTTSQNLDNITYFVSVKIGSDELVHPKVALDDTVTVPSFEHWPVNADGTMGGQYVQTRLLNGNKDVMPSEITIDGNFDEAVWSSLTDFYTNGGEYGNDVNLLDFADVKYNYKTSDSSSMKFKYDVRIDGEYLFGAVTAFVPSFDDYTVVRKSDGKTYTMVTAPDLYVYFFSDDDTIGTKQTDDSSFAAAYKQEAYPETVIQIRSQDNPTYCADLSVERCYAKYADIYLTKASDTDYSTHWPKAFGEETGFEGKRAAWPNNIYTFEFKVKLDYIPKYDYDNDGKDDIIYNISLSDRLSIEGTYSTGANNNNNRKHAWTGIKETVGEHSHYYYECNIEAGTVFNGTEIEAAKGKVVASKDNYSDGYLAQEYWPALTAADNVIDGSKYSGTQIQNIAYKITTDYEYLYGAALVKGSTATYLKFWLNRARNAQESFENANELNFTYTVDHSEGGIYTNTTCHENTTTPKLTDGTYIKDADPDNPANGMYLAWNELNDGDGNEKLYITSDFNDEYSVSYVDFYFGGGNAWGINAPDEVVISYSLNGTDYDYVNATLEKTFHKEDTSANDAGNYFHTYKYRYVFSEPVIAKNLRYAINPHGQFLWCSEIDVFGANADDIYDQYYLVSLPKAPDQSKIWIKKGSEDAKSYVEGTGTNEYPLSELQNIAKYKKIEGTDMCLYEFRVSLYDLGIDPKLTADEKDVLFSYYISATDGSDHTPALFHPKVSANSAPSNENWGIKYGDYNGAATFRYEDMLGNISIDGKLDESCWAGENVEMQHANASNGTWEKAPTKGNTLDYDYRVYAGENYLYGAVVVDTPAIASDKEYEYLNKNHTRFNLWIDNKIDEYSWNHDDDDKTIMNTSSDGVCYENYYYNAYLITDENHNQSTAQNYYICNGATPSWYGDFGTGANRFIDESNWTCSMTTINGKTYIEFMIDLDNFFCDRSTGFNYYIAITNAYGTETDDTSDDEILTLYHPALPRTEQVIMPLTLYNWDHLKPYPTDNAILFDHTSDQYDVSFENLPYWEKAVFSPVADKPNVYKVEFIHHAMATPNYDETAQGTHPKTLQEGWFAYALHYDNISPELSRNLALFMQTLKKDDYVVITGLDISELDVNPSGTGMLKGLLYAHAYHPSVSRENVLKGSDASNLYRPVYDPACRFEYKMMRLNEEKAIPDATYAANLPTSTTWDEINAGKIMQLTHFSPDVVAVNGVLDESVWGDENGWITVQDNINGTYQEATSLEEGTQYSYKLITDGEYLYVAMKLGSAYDKANSPSVRLWLKSDNAAESYTHFYEISYSESGTELGFTPPEASYTTAAGFAHEGLNGATVLDNGIKLENLVVFAKNNNPSKPNGGENYTAASKYGETALFGRSEEIQENMTSGEYYPTINTTKYYHAKESASMKAGTNGGTYVEFKVALSEFGAVDANKNYVGFEYFVQASFVKNGQTNTLFYPLVNIEADSDFSYYEQNHPTWDWSEKTSVKVTAEDIMSGDIRMRNNCVPVVTLGAKISDNYTASDGTTNHKAIRMGALYTEDYLRKWRANDENPIGPDDENYDKMNTAPVNDYWDVADMGIVMLPTQLLGADEKLTLETPRAVALSADNIIKWVNDADNGWSNFADYENFVFYATLYGLPSDSIKVSFCGYVDFYASTGTASFYDKEIIRSYEMVENIKRDDVHIEE